MLSPARKHFIKHQAAAQAADVEAGSSMEGRTEYELMLAKLHSDRRRLKDVKSVEQKAQVKAELLPDYIPWVQGVLAAGRGAQDEVLITVMVWRLDAGDWAGALEIAAYALDHKLVMPDQYKRDTATVVAEELAEQALRLIQGGRLSEVDAESLRYGEGLTLGLDMPDEVRAKLHKALGYVLRESSQLEAKQEALRHLKRALELHDKVGVKKDIEILERELKNLA